ADVAGEQKKQGDDGEGVELARPHRRGAGRPKRGRALARVVDGRLHEGGALFGGHGDEGDGAGGPIVAAVMSVERTRPGLLRQAAQNADEHGEEDAAAQNGEHAPRFFLGDERGKQLSNDEGGRGEREGDGERRNENGDGAANANTTFDRSRGAADAPDVRA